MVAAGVYWVKADFYFQYSLCRVVLMVAQSAPVKHLFVSPFSTRSVESF